MNFTLDVYKVLDIKLSVENNLESSCSIMGFLSTIINLVAQNRFIFQQIIVEKNLKAQDTTIVSDIWELFQAHFLNPTIQENIRNAKEEQYQEGFLRDLFVNVGQKNELIQFKK